jgi:hypothetical protein
MVRRKQSEPRTMGEHRSFEAPLRSAPQDESSPQCKIWLRNSLVRSCCGFEKNSFGVFTSTIEP